MNQAIKGSDDEMMEEENQEIGENNQFLDAKEIIYIDGGGLWKDRFLEGRRECRGGQDDLSVCLCEWMDEKE